MLLSEIGMPRVKAIVRPSLDHEGTLGALSAPDLRAGLPTENTLMLATATGTRRLLTIHGHHWDSARCMRPRVQD